MQDSFMMSEIYKKSSILDYPKPGLDPGIWESDGLMVKEVKEQIIRKIRNFFLSKDILNYKKVVKKILVIGSLTSYQYNSKSDIDVHLRIRLESFKKALKAQGMDLSDEKAVSLLDKDWRDQLNLEYGEKAYGTEHPIEFYFEIEGFTGAQQTDGVYDLLAGKWEKSPRTIDNDFDVEEMYGKSIESIEDLMQEFDVNIGEIKRTVQDVEFLQETVGKFEKSKRKIFYQKLKRKIDEIDRAILCIIEEGQKVVDQRKEDYSPESDTNIRFKYLQRYGYIWLIKQLEKVLKDEKTNEPEVGNLQDVKKVKEVIEEFEEPGAKVSYKLSNITKTSYSERYEKYLETGRGYLDDIFINDELDENQISTAIEKGKDLHVLYRYQKLTPENINKVIEKGIDLHVLYMYQKLTLEQISTAIEKGIDLYFLYRYQKLTPENINKAIERGIDLHALYMYQKIPKEIQLKKVKEKLPEFNTEKLPGKTYPSFYDVLRQIKKRVGGSESKMLVPYRDEEPFADFKNPERFQNPPSGQRPLMRDDTPHKELTEEFDEEHEMFFGPSFPQNLRTYSMRDIQADKVLYDNEWKTVMETDDGYVYTDNPEGVAILAYRIDSNGEYEFLLRNEKNPLFEDFITVITGRRDEREDNDDWYISTAVRELKEEAGLDIGEELDRIENLGSVAIGKNNKNLDVFLAIDVTGINQTEPETDGSSYEAHSTNFWVNEKELKEYVKSSIDTYLSTIVAKFLIVKENMDFYKNYLRNEYGYLISKEGE